MGHYAAEFESDREVTMDNIIKMFNAHWRKKTGNEMKDLRIDAPSKFWIKDKMLFTIKWGRSFRLFPLEVIDPHHIDNRYMLFFNPEYELFEAMEWKSLNNMGYYPYSAENHLNECAGLTVEKIIQYINDNVILMDVQS